MPPTNETLAEQAATLCGIAVMSVGMLLGDRGVVFATGFVIATGGVAHSCIASIKEARAGLRFRYALLSIIPLVLMMGVSYWIAWDYVPSLTFFLLVIGLGVISHSAVYFLVLKWLRSHRGSAVSINDENAEQ